jgi:Rad3-related DNA helicase
VKTREKLDRAAAANAFLKWRQLNDFYGLIEENEKMREYINHLTRENESLAQERNILELQTKKRNQLGANIVPLR